MSAARASDLPPVERVLRTAAPEWVCEDPLCGCGGVDNDYPRDTLGGLLIVAPPVLAAQLPPWDVSPHLFEGPAR